MHYPELLSSLKYYEIICHYKVTNRDKIKAFCICWTEYSKILQTGDCTALEYLGGFTQGRDMGDQSQTPFLYVTFQPMKNDVGVYK